MLVLPLDCWTCIGTALGQALHTSGCLGVDAYAEDDRCLYLDAPGLGPIISRISESQISVRPFSRRLVAHCNIASSSDGAGVLEYVALNDSMSALRRPCWAKPKGTAPLYRLIIDTHFANDMHSDWGAVHYTGAA